MKKIVLFITIFICVKMHSQTPNYEWGKMIGNNQNLYVYDNATDALGNIYLTGEYSGTVDFDPGTGSQNQTATATGGRDIFILKLDATGAFGWVKTYGGTGIDFGQRIAVDNTGNIYVGGRFQNSVNFTGYGGFASNGGYDGFLLKIDTTGTLEWVLDLSGGGTEGFLGLTTDSSGNIFTTGFFSTTSATLGGLNSTFTTLNRAGAGTNYDFFVAKYNTNGEIIWSNSTGAGYDEIPYNLALTDDNKVVTVGTFVGTSVDFNPGAASNLLYSNSNSTTTGFIQVLNASDGAFSWARSLGSSANDAVFGVASANNNIYVTGYFSGSQGDFNTTGSGGGDVINRIGSIDSFIAKYTSNSTFVWVKQIRGTTGSDVRGTSIAVKGTPEKVYASGTFTSQVYLNPASSTAYVGAFGGKDAFVVSLDDTGLYQWGGSVRSMDNEDAWGLSIDDNYNVYMTGYSASGNIALNPFANNTVPNNSTTGNDVFIVKLSQATLSNFSFGDDNSFMIYPNPVKEILYIENSLNRNIEIIRVIDVTGKVVLEQKGNERSVNLSNLNPGFYIVFITSEGKVSSQKIIKE
ncbi:MULTISPECIES: T9SS type A sorting domain-containing protein [unclassified Flavobacterium]|uniref:T9SS type A sorting domain-containing protein n=1 Tax=unclassified Flavobacterium TaxID=196869 RepID=UPI001291DB41|nr:MULTISPECIES: T9SS type A sorting domain-containing protein [unclassified Flavobacterium]MQP52167.1 T9SS type A sorting domain-containing protein [Flavobacterium sp. LMO9]MQP62037.1 T9SS type A sorting domain-containing protein [Flavobacterium sp. LMO6]